MAIIIVCLLYFGIGLLTLGSVAPPSNVTDRKCTFFIVLLLWPILWMIAIAYLARPIIAKWLKS